MILAPRYFTHPYTQHTCGGVLQCYHTVSANPVQCVSVLLRKLKSHELNDTDNEKVPVQLKLVLLTQLYSVSCIDDTTALECLQQCFRKCQNSHESGENWFCILHLILCYFPSWLFFQGADIAVTDMDGKTALHWTANNPDASSARVLLEMAPLSVNLKDNDGRTALHLAVVVGNRAVVEALVSCSRE